jgi:hypothetical protein
MQKVRRGGISDAYVNFRDDSTKAAIKVSIEA